MFGSHVTDSLTPYLEGRLDASSRHGTEAHLARCPRCRAALDDVRRGIALASELTPEPMPQPDAGRIAHVVRAAPLRGAADHGQWRWTVRTAAAVVVPLTAAIVYWQVNRPWVALHAADATSMPFETEARQIHSRLRAGSPPQFASQDSRRIRAWLTEQGAPAAALAPPDHIGIATFEPRGAWVMDVAGCRASVVSYRIDGRAVSLLVMSQEQLPDAPAAGWISKRVSHRQTPEGWNTLTWSSRGQTYVLVSELDGLGQRACFMCHADERFREPIETMTLR